MRLSFFNKARQPEPVDPRSRLQARVDYFQSRVDAIEVKVRAGLEPPSALDYDQTNLAEARQALADFDRERDQMVAADELRADRGASLFKEAHAADARIDAAARALEAALAEAEPVLGEIERDFRVKGGYAEPFRGSPIVERLRFWSDGVAVFHGAWEVVGQFAERLAAYRRLIESPREPQKPIVHKESPEAKAKRRRLALQNAQLRSKASPNGEGVTVTAENVR